MQQYQTFANHSAKQYQGNRAELLELVEIPAGARILDLGCAQGDLGELLKKQCEVEVIGIELNPDLAQIAARKLDSVFVGDIEQIELPYPHGYFDVLIFADVLEHLKDPWNTLARYKHYLKPSGMVILSIPNIRRFRIIIELLRGNFRYTDYGLMDHTHLHFFTYNEIKHMLNSAGFSIKKIQRNFQARLPLKIANCLLLNSLREFMVYQYHICASL